MSPDFIDELGTKIENVIKSLQQTREENKVIKGRVQELEDENTRLQNELETVQSDSSTGRVQLETAVEKIKNLISRLEIVE